MHRPFRRFPFAHAADYEAAYHVQHAAPELLERATFDNPKPIAPPLMSLRRAMPQARPLSLAALAVM